MRVDLLADHTLIAMVSAPFSSQGTETLAVYGLVIAEMALSVSVDDVRAVVLQFEPQQPTGDDASPAPGRRKAT